MSRTRRDLCAAGHYLLLLLGAVLRAALLAVGDAGGVERRADHLVADARQILHAAAADEHDRVLLQVVPVTRDVGADLDAVRQPDARDLAQRRVRLLRGGRQTRVQTPRRCGAPESAGVLIFACFLAAALANQLVDGGHAETGLPCG